MSALKVTGKKSLSSSLFACQLLGFSSIINSAHFPIIILVFFLVDLQVFMICPRYQPPVSFNQCKYFLPNFHMRSLVHLDSTFVYHASWGGVQFDFSPNGESMFPYHLFSNPSCPFDLWCHLHCTSSRTYMVSLWVNTIQINPPNKYKLESVATVLLLVSLCICSFLCPEFLLPTLCLVTSSSSFSSQFPFFLQCHLPDQFPHLHLIKHAECFLPSSNHYWLFHIFMYGYLISMFLLRQKSFTTRTGSMSLTLATRTRSAHSGCSNPTC